MAFVFNKGYEPPPQSNERAASPVSDVPPDLTNVSLSGLELIVKGLSHTRPLSAVEDLECLIRQTCEDINLPVICTPFPNSEASGLEPGYPDFAFLSLGDPYVVRPDILEHIIEFLNKRWKEKGLRVQRKISKNWDKSRRVSFVLENDANLDDFMKKLGDIFTTHKLGWQRRWPAPKARKVTYIFLDDAPDKLRGDTPFISGFHYHRAPECYIRPTYCLEGAVPNCREVKTAQSDIDRWIGHNLGPSALRWSRMGDDLNVYCAVLATPDDVRHFLNLPFTAFDSRQFLSGTTPGPPHLLYTLNGGGLSEAAFTGTEQTLEFNQATIVEQVTSLHQGYSSL